jgi:hypothetical protein
MAGEFDIKRLILAAFLLPIIGFQCSLAGSEIAPDTSFSEHVAALEKRVPNGFTIVVEPPFVVIGDEAPETVKLRAARTVKWAVDKLKKDYFKADPEETIDIWLFRDKESYERHARELFHDTPSTPFGYYSARDHALIMNIATGAGTLVHEIVHPFMRANFPQCPPWFNEGLASLYEASLEKEGHIRGGINWRLKGLERAIREKKTVSFQDLTAMTENQFYSGSNSTNYNQYYAQARYLCYYLQENNLLKTFYHQFVANAKQDPSGYRTLQRVLGTNDMKAFKNDWEEFILKLRNP